MSAPDLLNLLGLVLNSAAAVLLVVSAPVPRRVNYMNDLEDVARVMHERGARARWGHELKARASYGSMLLLRAATRSSSWPTRTPRSTSCPKN